MHHRGRTTADTSSDAGTFDAWTLLFAASASDSALAACANTLLLCLQQLQLLSQMLQLFWGC